MGVVFLRGFEGVGVDTPVQTLNLSGEGEGERGKEWKRKGIYLPLLLNIMCDKLQGL